MDVKLESFFDGIESKFDELLLNGFVKLDKPFAYFDDFDLILSNVLLEVGESVFKESSKTHIETITKMGVYQKLAPALYKLAVDKLNYKGNQADQYNIARLVRPTNSLEKYRAHFDSHLFTLVLPMHIPEKFKGFDTGELIYSANVRRQPKSEIENILGKLWFKQYANKNEMEKLLKKGEADIEPFDDLRPILFIGNTTLHTNRAVQKPGSYRLTLISHFFDPSPKWGLGSILRKVRGR